MEIDLAGKVAVVTGASSGIGAQTAEVLGAHGARVVAVGRDEPRLAATVDRITSAGGDATAVVVDLCADAAPAAVLEATGDDIDVLALAAGTFASTPFADTTLEELDDLYAVHVRAPFRLAQASIDRMRDGASILFYSSTVTQAGFAPYAAYTAVKGAVDAMARSLAMELAPRIRVNTIVPGFTHTPMVGNQIDAFPDLEGMIVAKTPTGVLGDATSAANMAAYLVSDLGAYVCGSRMVIDGGWTAAGWQAG